VTAPTEVEAAVKAMQELTEAARTFKNANAMNAMAAIPEQRVMLEQALAQFNAYHPVIVDTAREIGLCRAVLSKVLRRRRFGILG
jgi:ActR/RegA family two-component response regulator